MRRVLAFDIGGSKLIAGIVDESGSIVSCSKYKWKALDEQSVLDVLLGAGKSMIKQNGDVSGIGAAIPGLCDPGKGLWVESVFSGLRNIPISDILSREFGLPTAIENDVNACALAEKKFGRCRDIDDFVWITVSNGCGGALFLGGALYSGAFGNAGEIGHIIVEEQHGMLCGCGNTGCLEAQAAGPGIVRRYLMKKPGSEHVSAADIAERARGGEQAAIEAYTDEGKYLGRAVAAAANLINPQKVIIGGGVSASFDLFSDELFKTVQQRVYRTANREMAIQTTGLGYYAPLIGAATLALSS